MEKMTGDLYICGFKPWFPAGCPWNQSIYKWETMGKNVDFTGFTIKNQNVDLKMIQVGKLTGEG